MSTSLLQCCTNMAQLMECGCDVDEKGKKVIKEYNSDDVKNYETAIDDILK